MHFLSYALIAIAAYLLGSIPTGFLVARAKGIDIRKVGSGNIGATNALRVLGKPAGILVLLVDALKGWRRYGRTFFAWIDVVVPALAKCAVTPCFGQNPGSASSAHSSPRFVSCE